MGRRVFISRCLDWGWYGMRGWVEGLVVWTASPLPLAAFPLSHISSILLEMPLNVELHEDRYWASPNSGSWSLDDVIIADSATNLIGAPSPVDRTITGTPLLLAGRRDPPARGVDQSMDSRPCRGPPIFRNGPSSSAVTGGPLKMASRPREAGVPSSLKAAALPRPCHSRPKAGGSRAANARGIGSSGTRGTAPPRRSHDPRRHSAEWDLITWKVKGEELRKRMDSGKY